MSEKEWLKSQTMIDNGCDDIYKKYCQVRAEINKWHREAELLIDPLNETDKDTLLEEWREKYLQSERDEKKERRAMKPQAFFVILDEDRNILFESDELTPQSRDWQVEWHQKHQNDDNYIYKGMKIEICTDIDDPPKLTIRPEWLDGYD